MVPEQDKDALDYLSTFSVRQLRELLRTELEEKTVNVELIKNINAVLALKTGKSGVDVAAAYESFQALSDTEPLFPDALEEAENARPARKRPKLRRLVKLGTAVALAALLLIGTGLAAHAMGFDFREAVSRWTEDRFGLFARTNTNMYGVEDACQELREQLSSLGVSARVVPSYVPAGAESGELSQIEGVDGRHVLYLLFCGEENIVFDYTLLEREPSSLYPKDRGEPELYTMGGIDHYIFTNVGKYTAVWLNGDVRCNIAGLVEKDELLKMIDSIYAG